MSGNRYVLNCGSIELARKSPELKKAVEKYWQTAVVSVAKETYEVQCLHCFKPYDDTRWPVLFFHIADMDGKMPVICGGFCNHCQDAGLITRHNIGRLIADKIGAPGLIPIAEPGRA